MYPGNIPGAPHNNKVRGICKPGLETQTPLYRSGETRTLDEIALDESREAGRGALTDSGPEREGDGAGRCGEGRMKGTRWTTCWAKIRGTKEGGREMDGTRMDKFISKRMKS